ncbi:MAG: AAA family ATPase [Rubrivivax sp.]|nr:AAA family ATPase [Rubrivivax sp.]
MSTPDPAALQAAIAALEAQRALLGDAVVDAALGPMREQLGRLAGLPARPALPAGGPAAEPAPPEQALKQVAVLFLDVVGSTALSQHLDPEDIHEVMDGALARCTEVVVAHGGKVLQYAGDNLLAAFGAERRLEDDAERAVHCALALLAEGRALGERVRRSHGHDGCNVRVGIHTGPVLLGGGVDEEGTIRGLTVNIAARMEQTAPVGALRISHDTFLQVRGVFDVQAQPPLMVKGRDEPLLTYFVQRAKPRAFRVETRGIEGVATPLVGRDAELAQLAALPDRVAAERTLHAATVIGQPGLGKSRLLRELQGLLEAHPQRFWLLLGRAHQGARLQPYGLVRDLLAWRLQIADSDGSELARTKLVDGLVPYLGAQAEAKAHRIGQLIGLDFAQSPHVRGLEPRQLRELGFSALRGYLRGLAAEGAALAMLLEDLQWADDASLDFISELLNAKAMPLMLLATARPELLERRPAWGQGVAAHRLLRLPALDAAQGDHLARALLARVTEGAPQLHALLVAQAGGNPFYMEELVRMFLDDGVIVAEGDRGDRGDRGDSADGGAGGDHWRVLPGRLSQARVPTTLVGVLQARLDALPAADRLALQQASIVGPVFWDRALAALDPQAEASVPTLQHKELIHRRDGSAFEGTPEEAFHHHLLQQVTYDTVLRPARRAGHAAVAQWLAERVGDRSAEYLAVTGEHYERAGDHARALDYFHRAALDAEARSANAAALEHLERALRSPAATDPRLRNRLLFLQQTVADLTGQRALQEQALQQRNEIAEALDDDALRADLLGAHALLASRRGDEAAAHDLATRALALARRSGNAEVAALALGQIAWSRYSQGDIPAALTQAQAAMTHVREALRDQPTKKLELLEVQLLTLRSIVEHGFGDLRQTRATCLEALALAKQRGLRRPQVSTLASLAGRDLEAGRYHEALAQFEAATAIAREIGWTIYIALGHYNAARCHFELGDHEQAAAQLADAEPMALRCESRDTQGRCALLRGRLAAAAGEADAAREAFARALEIFEALDAAGFVCQVRADVALLHLAQGQLPLAQALAEQVEAALATGLSLANTEDLLRPRMACHRVWAAAGDPRARAALEAAHAELQAMTARAGGEETQVGIRHNIALHREIAAAWAATRQSTPPSRS